MLEMDGKVYTQSSAVLRAASRKGGFVPSDAYEARSASYKAWGVFGASEEDQKNYRVNILPNHLSNFQRQLGENEFFVGNKLSVADITVYDFCRNYANIQVPGSIEPFDKLNAWFTRMQAYEKIKTHEDSD